jgi:hypothetical protein
MHPADASSPAPPRLRVLRFSAEHFTPEGLPYDSYMGALVGPLSGLEVPQLTAALEELERDGSLQVEGAGSPHRRFRLTDAGRQELARAVSALPSSHPSPGGSHAPGTTTTMEDREKLIEQRDEESRKRLRLVIEREDAVRGAEEKLRTEEKRLLEVEEQLASRGRQLDQERAEHAARVQKDREQLESEKGGVESERKRIQAAGQALQRAQFELEQAKEKFAADTADLARRQQEHQALLQQTEERERRVTAQEDALHEHITSLKDHLAHVHTAEEGVQKIHGEVTEARKRRKP